MVRVLKDCLVGVLFFAGVVVAAGAADSELPLIGLVQWGGVGVSLMGVAAVLARLWE